MAPQAPMVATALNSQESIITRSRNSLSAHSALSIKNIPTKDLQFPLKIQRKIDHQNWTITKTQKRQKLKMLSSLKWWKLLLLYTLTKIGKVFILLQYYTSMNVTYSLEERTVSLKNKQLHVIRSFWKFLGTFDLRFKIKLCKENNENSLL